jgi:predicted Zn-dependent peptidase
LLFAGQGCTQPDDIDIPNLKFQIPNLKFQRVAHPDKLTFPQLEVKIPKPERIVLKNGLVVYLLEDYELPLITIKVLIKTGCLYDEKDKSGTANLVARLLRTGGTEKYPIELLDEKLEFIAAELNTSCNYEEIQITFSFLSRDLEMCLEILKEVLFAPRFPDDKLEKEKSRILEVIRRENDSPDAIAEREFRKLVYPSHPYGKSVYGTQESVQRLNVSDIKQYHQDYFSPSNIIVGITGRFDKSLPGFIKELFEPISSRDIKHPESTSLQRDYPKSINLIPKEVNQAVIRLGHLGIERLNPDFFNVIMMNAILGGTSVSRLYDQIREQRGLAYGIFSYFVMPKNIGMFIVDTSTKNESVHQVVSLILSEIKRIKEELVKESELANTKDAILNGFVFRFENPVTILEQYIFIEHIGLPEDYLETYRDNIMKVSREDIRRVAQKYLQEEDYILLVVGDSKKFDRHLTDFGRVNEINLNYQ